MKKLILMLAISLTVMSCQKTYRCETSLNGNTPTVTEIKGSRADADAYEQQNTKHTSAYSMVTICK